MLLRAAITKGEQVRYLSHLDYARSVERALRRAQLPVAYSEGFNPHVKLAFGSALSLGVTGLQEYFDVELVSDLAPSEFLAQLADSLPEGIAVAHCVAITPSHKALMAMINYSTYSVELPLAGDFAAVQIALENFNSAETANCIRHSPKGKREIDVKKFVQEPVTAKVVGTTLQLSFAIDITPTGSVKASEVVEVLTDLFALPGRRELALIQRDGLWVKQGSELLSPLELRG